MRTILWNRIRTLPATDGSQRHPLFQNLKEKLMKKKKKHTHTGTGTKYTYETKLLRPLRTVLVSYTAGVNDNNSTFDRPTQRAETTHNKIRGALEAFA